ncbi:phosphoesterase [Clostridium polyendosporum]|uniref:Phosphoesterase n=1 Tax=Clostridium polyendosporum TaxID=69208 RepID=A0A919VHB3_9CLOT|nr:YfcE family phosphodiesterase [Clostridium polyendosporum]GIM30077.1 phosphoesterase [Clostridium polyendosporum]
MRFAVIGDIHSNKYALESVLEDIDTKNVDFIVSTGDLVGYLPFPNEVIQLIKKYRVISVQGNHDKYIAESNPLQEKDIIDMSEEKIQGNASSIFTNLVISDENRVYLKGLPTKISFHCNGLKILVVHGSHREIDEYLYEDKENLYNLSKSIDEDILICGHTHIPYNLTINKKHFINAGSVGKPKNGAPQATYITVDVKDEKVYSEIIKVDYNIEGIVKAIEENKMISNKLISMLKEGF